VLSINAVRVPYITVRGNCTKQTVWQGGINVPFMVSAGPGIPPGNTSNAVGVEART
jgi:hypothetical protein